MPNPLTFEQTQFMVKLGEALTPETMEKMLDAGVEVTAETLESVGEGVR